MADSALEKIEDLLHRGENLRAADLGAETIGEDASQARAELVWMTALALARCGATDRSSELLTSARIAERPDLSAKLAEDIAALGARLFKDRALGPKETSLSAARRSAGLYAAVAVEYQSSYAAVNAATMYLLAGDRPESGRLARQTLELLDASEARSRPDYWWHVTSAESHLVLGDYDSAAAALAGAGRDESDWSMRGTTLRQLRLVCELAGVSTDVLENLPLPTIAHYTGHMFSNGPEKLLRSKVDEVLARRSVGAVYGSMACGSDLVVVEAALASGIEVHISLPCSAEQFVEWSVRPGGENWVERWHRAIGQVTDVYEEPTAPLSDDAMFTYCDELAMGAALIRGNQLGAEVVQIAVWDGEPSEAEAGTASAVDRWRDLGGFTEVIPFDRLDFGSVVSPEVDSATHRERKVRALLFADIKGFSQLSEPELPVFFEGVMGALASVLDNNYRDTLVYRNTWGDALYLVFTDPAAAAECALDLQECLANFDPQSPTPVTARIGVHAGPVFEGHDPVRGEPNFYGTHVNRAARIEPRTPPGEVYVTANFAELVAVRSPGDFRMEYVGHVPTAKDYGSFPMYVLRR